MSRWLAAVLTRVHELAHAGELRLTAKAFDELSSLDLALDADDVRDVLLALTADDSVGRLRSAITDEWMYIWKPEVFETVLYVKLIVRDNCVILSFHEDEGGRHEEAP
jgi:Motility quorum-sensing regulator, toxin of MqsA